LVIFYVTGRYRALYTRAKRFLQILIGTFDHGCFGGYRALYTSTKRLFFQTTFVKRIAKEEKCAAGTKNI
tara:strand:+ start:15 stop:224 length:210 start_codon:yes stop_codon:yes gene_type:complete